MEEAEEVDHVEADEEVPEIAADGESVEENNDGPTATGHAVPLEEIGLGEPVEVMEKIDECKAAKHGRSGDAGENRRVGTEIATEEVDEVAVEIGKPGFGVYPVLAG